MIPSVLLFSLLLERVPMLLFSLPLIAAASFVFAASTWLRAAHLPSGCVRLHRQICKSGCFAVLARGQSSPLSGQR